MNKWLTWLIVVVIVLATFWLGVEYGSRQEQASVRKQFDESSSRSKSRVKREHPSRQGKFRSAVFKKSIVIGHQKKEESEGEWVTIPKERFIEMAKDNYRYQTGLSSTGGAFSRELMLGLGINDVEVAPMNKALQELGKQVYQLRDQHATYEPGSSPNEVIINYDDFDAQLETGKHNLRDAIFTSLGRGRAELFMEVTQMDKFLADSANMFSKGRVRLHRELKTIPNTTGGEPKKEITFWVYNQKRRGSSEIWTDEGGSGSQDAVWGDDAKLFRNAGLYPWPEQGIKDEHEE